MYQYLYPIPSTRFVSMFLANATRTREEAFVDTLSIETKAYRSFGEIRVTISNETAAAMQTIPSPCVMNLSRSFCPLQHHDIWKLRYPLMNTRFRTQDISVVLQDEQEIVSTYWCEKKTLPSLEELAARFNRVCGPMLSKAAP